MSRELFGTDGLRGIAGQYPLDGTGAHRIGMAIGALFGQPGQGIVIASDPRESSAMLVAHLIDGLTNVGMNVTNIGIITTPGLAYITRSNDEFAAGVMVTASHNSYQYNGIKVFDDHGDKLSDETETKLNALIIDGVTEYERGVSTNDGYLTKTYEDFLVKTVGDLKLDGLAVAIDTANGASCGIAERVFTRLGARVKPMFDSPDGRNINDQCGSTSTAALQKQVVDGQLALGIALDGDADRIMMVDNQGRQVNGDYLLYMLAVVGNLKGVVATVMSNLGLEQSLSKSNIALARTQVGDRYVLEGLASTGFTLGGEQSGHIIFPAMLATGDGLLAAVQVMLALKNSDRSLAQWRDEVRMLPQALVNISLPKKSYLERPEVQEFIRQQTGLLGDAGRLLIRPSGTEPLARVMVEAPNAERLVRQIANKLEELIA